MLSVKEIKAFLETGQTMGLAGEELRKYVESEKAAALEIERATLVAATAAEEQSAAKQPELEKQSWLPKLKKQTLTLKREGLPRLLRPKKQRLNLKKQRMRANLKN